MHHARHLSMPNTDNDIYTVRMKNTTQNAPARAISPTFDVDVQMQWFSTKGDTTTQTWMNTTSTINININQKATSDLCDVVEFLR